MKTNFKEMAFLFLGLLALALGAVSTNLLISLSVVIFFFIYSLINYRNGLILLFAYFPLRPFLIELNPTLKIIGDLIILAVLLRVIYIFRKDWKSLFRFYVYELSFFAFLILGSFSAYFISDVQAVAIIFQVRSFLLMYLIFYIVKRIGISNEDLRKLSWTIVVMVLILGVHGLIEKVGLRTLLLPEAWVNMPLSAVNRIRIYGLTGNPNALAIFMSFSLIFLFYLRKQLTNKLLFSSLIILALSIIIMTYSRGTWIALLISLISYVFMTKNWKLPFDIVFHSVLAFFLIVAPVNYIIEKIESTDYGMEQRETQKKYDKTEGSASDRLTGTFNKETVEGSKKSGRLYIVDKGFQVFKEYPIIGTGFGTFGDSATLSYGSPIYEKYEVSHRFYSDNQYIQIIVQTGILGGILFATFLLGMLFYLIKNQKEFPYFSLTLSLLLGIYALGLLYNSWESYVLTLFYYPIFGFCVSHKNSV